MSAEDPFADLPEPQWDRVETTSRPSLLERLIDRVVRIPTLRDLDARCTRPPKGWYCNLDDGHDGPCPARPVSRRVRKQYAWICPCRHCRRRDKRDARIARALARGRG